MSGYTETDSARPLKASLEPTRKINSTNSQSSMMESGLEKYEVGKNSRKLALVINIRDFSMSRRIQIPRKRLSDVDEEVITNMLRDTLGFDVIPKHDLNRADLIEFFQEVQTWPFKDVDAMAVVLMSYGDNRTIYTSDGETIQIKTLLDYLKGDKCDGLANKPKIVFINAGPWEEMTQTVEDDGFDEVDSVKDAMAKITIEDRRICIPRECDFIHVYSPVMGGHMKSGNIEQANIFLTALSEMCLKLHGEQLEFCDLLTRTNRQVALRVSSASSVPARPCFFLSTLTKELYLPAKT